MDKNKKEVNPIKTTKRWLYELNQYRQAICSLREILKCVDGLEGIKYNGMPSSGKIGDPTSELVYRREELVLKLRNTESIVKLIEEALNTLTDNERIIVEKRYVYGTPWKVIKDQNHYSRSGVFKVGQRGLHKVVKSLFGEEVDF